MKKMIDPANLNSEQTIVADFINCLIDALIGLCVDERKSPAWSQWTLAEDHRRSIVTMADYHEIRDAYLKPVAKLSNVAYYLDLAIDVSHERMKPVMAGVYEPSPASVRKVCLIWATWMAERAEFTTSELNKMDRVFMDDLRRALDQVRNHDAVVDIDTRKVYCAKAGDVIEFSI